MKSNIYFRCVNSGHILVILRNFFINFCYVHLVLYVRLVIYAEVYRNMFLLYMSIESILPKWVGPMGREAMTSQQPIHILSLL